MTEEQPATDLTPKEFANYVGAKDDDAHAVDALTEARELVDRVVRKAAETVPQSVVNRAYKEVGSELFWRRTAPNGIRQFGTPDGGGAMRAARDPMVAAWPILEPFLGLGFA